MENKDIKNNNYCFESRKLVVSGDKGTKEEAFYYSSRENAAAYYYVNDELVYQIEFKHKNFDLNDVIEFADKKMEAHKKEEQKKKREAIAVGDQVKFENGIALFLAVAIPTTSSNVVAETGKDSPIDVEEDRAFLFMLNNNIDKYYLVKYRERMPRNTASATAVYKVIALDSKMAYIFAPDCKGYVVYRNNLKKVTNGKSKEKTRKQ